MSERDRGLVFADEAANRISQRHLTTRDYSPQRITSTLMHESDDPIAVYKAVRPELSNGGFNVLHNGKASHRRRTPSPAYGLLPVAMTKAINFESIGSLRPYQANIKLQTVAPVSLTTAVAALLEWESDSDDDTSDAEEKSETEKADRRRLRSSNRAKALRALQEKYTVAKNEEQQVVCVSVCRRCEPLTPRRDFIMEHVKRVHERDYVSYREGMDKKQLRYVSDFGDILPRALNLVLQLSSKRLTLCKSTFEDLASALLWLASKIEFDDVAEQCIEFNYYRAVDACYNRSEDEYCPFAQLCCHCIGYSSEARRMSFRANPREQQRAARIIKAESLVLDALMWNLEVIPTPKSQDIPTFVCEE
jgi:hypothetical protein